MRNNYNELPEKPARDKGNEALRELAGRIKSLSYRDMVTLSDKLASLLLDTGNHATALLAVADELEKA